MFIDISIDYDASFEDFHGEAVLDIIRGHYWIGPHTKRGQNYLQTMYNINLPLHERQIVTNDKGKEIWQSCKNYNISNIYGGFYYTDKSHKYHI